MARVAGVPLSLVGREVGVRAVIPIWEGVRALGLDPEQLAVDTGYSVKHLTTASERMSWDGFARMMDNLGRLLDDDQLVALGAKSVDSPFFRAMLLPARMLFSIEDIFRWTFAPAGPAMQLIPVNTGNLVSLGPGHIRLEIRARPGYRPSRENFLVLRGSIIGLARIAKQPATVRMTTQPNGVDFEIRVPAHTGLVSRVRRAISRVSNDQLARANGELYERYAELEREVATRINVELELRRSEQRYRDLFESAPLPMWVFDTSTLRFLAVNRSAVRIYGYSDEEFATMTLADLRPAEDVETFYQAVGDGDATRMWRHRTKAGAIMYVQVSTHDLTFEGRAARLVHVFDLTQRLVLEEQLRQAQKMEAIGQLAGGVAHDFNNLLMVISSYTDLLMRESHDSEDLRAIRSAADRGADLTRKLLAFARRKAIEPRVLDLGEVIEDMRVLLRPVLSRGHALVLDIAAERGLVRVDPGGVEQIVMNLAVNARDAMPEGGTIKISVRDIEIDEDYARANVGILPGPHVAMAIADTGIGMDATTLARAFEPFFTTKEVGKGTGLGLATVLGIVQQNGGHIHIDSEPALGTSITIYFPRCAPTPETVVPAPDHATILVIEDDDVLRAAARDVLEEVGYEVLVASDAESALAVCAGTSEIDLVVSDIMLNQVNSLELAQQLRRHRPELKLLWMSGYAADAVVVDGRTGFLKKPFTAELLVERVRSLL